MINNFSENLKKMIIDVSELIKCPIKENDIYIVHQPQHHKPIPLPKDKMAVYTFLYKEEFLKIGQANYKSKARYQSHHYHLKSGVSTLAKSLVNDPAMSDVVSEDNVSDWIKNNCERYDVIIDKSYGKFALNFIEGLLHYKYQPKYESRT